MLRLFLLYAYDRIIDSSSSFFESKAISPDAFRGIREMRETLLEEIRPDALTLVEAFEYSDHTLMSAIGRSDGRPYDHLMECFRNSNDVNQPKQREEMKSLAAGLMKFHLELPPAKL